VSTSFVLYVSSVLHYVRYITFVTNYLLIYAVRQVCGSMPYDDSDVRRMIKHQTERKVVFSRRVRLSEDVRSLIHAILEVRVDLRLTTANIAKHVWMTSSTQPAALTTNVSSNNDKRLPLKAEPLKPSSARREHVTTPTVVGVEVDGSIAAGGLPLSTTADRTDLGVATASPVDGLSHNNSARDSDVLPRPLDKTKKTMQLNVIQTAMNRHSDLDESTTSTFREMLGEEFEEGTVIRINRKVSY